MPEPTATNPQTGEKIVFRGGQWVPMTAAPAPAPAPSLPSHIPGTPKPIDPFKVAGDLRDQTRTDIAIRGEGRDVEKIGRDIEDTNFSQAGSLREKFFSDGPVKNYETVIRYYGTGVSAEDTSAGDMTLINSFAKMQNPDSTVMQGEADAAASQDPTVQQILTTLKREFAWDGAGKLSPDARAWMLNEMQTIAENANASYTQRRSYYGDLAKRYGFDPFEVIGPHTGEPYLNSIRARREEILSRERGLPPAGAGSGVESNPWPGVVGQDGKPLPPEGGYGRDPETGEWGLYGSVTGDGPQQLTPEQQRAQDVSDKTQPDSPTMRLAQHGLSLGLDDEAAGIGGALSNLFQGESLEQGYINARDAERRNIGKARQEAGWTGTAAEVVGSGGAAGVNSLLRLAPANVFKEGATIGGVGGFGYGEGTQGSMAGLATNALLAGSLAKGADKFGNYLSSRVNPARAEIGTRAADLNRAGQAEGVTVNHAMVAPGLANRVTGVDASLAGGRRVQGEMGRIEGQLEQGVQRLGRDGRPMDNLTAGDTVKGAAERFIDKSGQSAKVKYDRAERMAGDAKVAPKESLSRVDEMIATLGETPASNEAELAFLNKIKSDLSKDLSVGGLRRMRTSLRKKISRGELVFGEDEARVLSIMDAAADDIRVGLTAQGRGKAASAFDAADKAYRARMDYITGTLQKIIGKRGSNHSAEQIFQRFENLSKPNGDSRSLRKLYASLEPDEAADVAATFAQDLGKNNKGDFSVAHFLSQSNNLSDQALLTIFGKEGAASVRNLRSLGKEVNRVTGAMNSRTSKSAIPGDYRSWLFNMVLGGGGALAGSPEVMAAAVGLGAVKAGRDVLSARALMSPNITKWLKMAPNTANPKAINTHYQRLAEIAKAEPALANEIEVFRSAIMQAANDNPAVLQSAAKEKDSEQR